jgi:phage tail tape-measure protein
VTIKAVDQFSGRMRGTVLQSLEQFKRAANAAQGASSSMGNMVMAVSGKMGSALFAVAKTIGDTVLGALSRLGAAGARALGGLVSGLMNVAKWSGIATLGLTGLVVRNSINAAMEMEGYLAKLEVALKDTAKAQEMMAWAKEFAAKTPFDVGGVVDATARLEMYGMSATKWLPLVGDLAGAMGRDVTDAVEAVADAVMGGGLERLKEFGINSQMLLKYGAASSSQGGVSYQGDDATERLKGALERLISERYGGGMAKMFETAKGKVSNFKDSIQALYVTIGRALMPSFGKALSVVQSFIQQLTNSGAAQKFGDALAAGAEKLLTWAQVGLPVLIDQLRQVGEWFSSTLPGAINFVRGHFDGWMSSALEHAEQLRQGFFRLADGALTVAEQIEDAFRTNLRGIMPGWIVLLNTVASTLDLLAGARRMMGDRKGAESAGRAADQARGASDQVRIQFEKMWGNDKWRDKYGTARGWLNRSEQNTRIPDWDTTKANAQGWWRGAKASTEMNINVNVKSDGTMTQEEQLRQEILRVVRGEFRQMRWASG